MPQYQRKLKSGYRWYYKFSYLGQIYFSKCIYLTKKEAQKAERECYLMLEQQDTQPVYKEVMLLDLINERLEYIKSKKSNKYYKENKYYLDKLLDFVGNVLVKEITKNDINKLLMKTSNELKRKNCDNYSVNSMIRVVKALFNYGINYLDLNIINPCKGITFYSVNKQLKYIPTEFEINTLLNLCNHDQQLLIKFVMETGGRVGEALRFTYNDIKDKYIVLYTRKSKDSNLVPRKLPLPDCLKYIEFPLDRKERVFKRWKEYPKFLEKKLKKVGNNLWGWHNLRHRYASLLSKQNKPIFEISQLLGHSSIQTTQLYLQLLS